MLWFCRSCTQLLHLLQNFLILMSFTKVRMNHTNMEVCYIYSFRLYWTYASSARLSKTISSRTKASHTIIRVPTAMASFTTAPVLWWWILSHFCWTPTIYASLRNGSSRRRVSGFNEQNDWVDWLSIKLEEKIVENLSSRMTTIERNVVSSPCNSSLTGSSVQEVNQRIPRQLTVCTEFVIDS